MNTVFISTYRRPFLTKLCLEALVRAYRWERQWASMIFVCISTNGDSRIEPAVKDVIERNLDANITILHEPRNMTPHEASKWMLDCGFSAGSQMVLYVEDDAIVSPDAFKLLRYAQDNRHPQDAAVCLYHETMPEHYPPHAPPDPLRLHHGNGINTLGGTAFFRDHYLSTFGPNWNCKQVEPKGFDYSAHYLMYVHSLYAIWPDMSRSVNLGFEDGNASLPFWQKYCGRSLWVQTDKAVRDHNQFRLDEEIPPRVQEEWMKAELLHRAGFEVKTV